MTIQDQMRAERMSWIRCIYLTVYVVVYALAYSIQILMWKLTVFHAIYYMVAAAGGALLILDFFRRRIFLTYKYVSFLILFVVALVVSMLSQMRYGIVGNIQATVWFLIHFFVLAAVDTELPNELHRKQLRIVMNAFGVVWFVLVLWSLGQYVTQFYTEVYDAQCGWSRRVGFTEARLFGTFSDPNYASASCAAAIAFAVYNLIEEPKNVVLKVFSWTQIVAQFFYIVLAASRTVQLGLLVVLVFFVALYGWKAVEKRTKALPLRIVLVLLAVALSLVLSVLLYTLIHQGLSYIPMLAGYAQDGLDMERPDVVGTSDFSNNRAWIYSNYIELAKNAPWFGLTPRNAVAYAQENFPDSYIATSTMVVHSGFLGLFVYTGLVGGTIMMCWLVMVVLEVVRYLIRRRNDADSHYNRVLVLSMFLVVAAIGAGPQLMLFYSNRIHDVLFWVTLGYVRAFIRMSEPERYEKMPLPYCLTERVFARFKKPQKAE